MFYPLNLDVGLKTKRKAALDPISDFSLVRKSIHRPIKIDTYTRTSDFCKEHEECEIIYKCYTVLIFGGGRIECVGITEKKLQRFCWCSNEVKNFLIEKGLNPEDLEIVKMNKTLENFKFELANKELHIDLYRLNNLFVGKIKKGEVVNINLNNIFETINKLMENSVEFEKIEELVENSIQDHDIKHYLIAKKDLYDFFKTLDPWDLNKKKPT